MPPSNRNQNTRSIKRIMKESFKPSSRKYETDCEKSSEFLMQQLNHPVPKQFSELQIFQKRYNEHNQINFESDSKRVPRLSQFFNKLRAKLMNLKSENRYFTEDEYQECENERDAKKVPIDEEIEIEECVRDRLEKLKPSQLTPQINSNIMPDYSERRKHFDYCAQIKDRGSIRKRLKKQSESITDKKSKDQGNYNIQNRQREPSILTQNYQKFVQLEKLRGYDSSMLAEDQ